MWSKALAKADLGFHVTPHGLRHAHASWLLAGGADLQIVKERLGHSSITTTEKYLHTLPGANQAALHALDVIRGSRVVGIEHPSVATPRDIPNRTELQRIMETLGDLLAAMPP